MIGTLRRALLGALLITVVPSAFATDPSTNWPSFRGPLATGVADGHDLPMMWDVATGEHVKWKTRIPGLAHACPIVWGDRVYITSAVSGDADPYLKTGLYGESPDHPEEIVHDFRVYCLNKKTGEIVWEHTAFSGIPKVKRHVKSSHANCTPATDGKHVVAFFGSEGLYCYDIDGKLLWSKDLGVLDAGAFNAPEVQWAFGSSPIIHKNMVIVQCDVNNDSFLAAYDVATGTQVWRTPRDSSPCWGTPTVLEHDGRTQVIVNGYEYMGGYDATTGAEIWRLKGGGDVPVPTPFVAHNLIYITNAHGPLNPIYAIRPDATGDISLKEGETRNKYIKWSRPKRGSYIPTTIAYGKYLYVGDDRGILSCYDAKTGAKMYRERLAGGMNAFSASPVAGDKKVYFTSESGDILVVKAGKSYKLLATNSMGEPCLATPAISEGMFYVRTSKHLYGIGD